MNSPRAFIFLAVLSGVLSAAVAVCAAEDATVPGEFRHYSTIHSIGVEWDITGDANHNATCKVRYRTEGAANWKEALPLFRVDYHGWYDEKKADRAYNMVAGSVLFLEPGTKLEVELDLAAHEFGKPVAHYGPRPEK